MHGSVARKDPSPTLLQTHFYILRTLLGLTEAGAFPGMWFLLNKFYPPDRITFAFAVAESGVALSYTIAAPAAAACVRLRCACCACCVPAVPAVYLPSSWRAGQRWA